MIHKQDCYNYKLTSTGRLNCKETIRQSCEKCKFYATKLDKEIAEAPYITRVKQGIISAEKNAYFTEKYKLKYKI